MARLTTMVAVLPVPRVLPSPLSPPSDTDDLSEKHESKI